MLPGTIDLGLPMFPVFAFVSEDTWGTYGGNVGRPRFTYAAFFLSAQRAFIIADNFFFMAGVIGFRAADFLETDLAAFGPALPFCFAHHAFFAAPILARAAALI